MHYLCASFYALSVCAFLCIISVLICNISVRVLCIISVRVFMHYQCATFMHYQCASANP